MNRAKGEGHFSAGQLLCGNFLCEHYYPKVSRSFTSGYEKPYTWDDFIVEGAAATVWDCMLCCSCYLCVSLQQCQSRKISSWDICSLVSRQAHTHNNHTITLTACSQAAATPSLWKSLKAYLSP